MTHPRLIAANDRVALKVLEGQVQAKRFVTGEMKQVIAPVTDLRRSPVGGVDKQLLFGAGFLELESDVSSGYSFGQSLSDDYVGYVLLSALDAPVRNTHHIATFGGHLYAAADMKTTPVMTLPFGSQLSVKETAAEFVALENGGFVPAQQIAPLDLTTPDFVATAQRFLGVPYLWGGDSNWGIDCSGLVQQSLASAGIACPRDSDMQEAWLGSVLDNNAPLRRGDFIFWAGHIGIMCDPETLIHANAYHMAVTCEPLAQVCLRIKQAGGGEITRKRRL